MTDKRLWEYMNIKPFVIRCERLYDRCKKYDVISFDIFDTSLIRLVDTPQNVFDIVGREIKDGVFKEKRVYAQSIAERKYGKKTNLEHIYQELISEGVFDESRAEKVLRMEIDVEDAVCVARATIKELVSKLADDGKTIIFLSDMYISGEYLERILKSHGFNGFERVIVSSDCGKNKIDGDAFEYVSYLYPGKKIIHIGDNVKTDFINARKYGVASILISRINMDNLDKLIAATAGDNKSPYQWGYVVISKIAYGFIEWLASELSRKRPEKVLFLTREGVLFKEIFDIFGYSKKYETDLFYASRRSMLCALAYIDKEFVSNYLIKTRCSLNEVYKIFGLSTDEVELLQKKYKFSNDTRIDGLPKFNRLISAVFKLAEFQINDQYDLLMDYVKQFELDGKVALVDIGWNGTMQFLLGKLIKNMELNVHLCGYYLGEFTNPDFDYGITKYGYLCNGSDSDSVTAVTNGAYILEQCFTPRMGSTIGYRREKNEVQPLLKEVAQDPIMTEVQKGVLNSAKEISRHNGVINFCINYDTLLDPIKYPDKYYAEILGDMKWVDFESNRYMAKPENMRNYILKPKKLILDMQRSGWKSAFLKRLLKIPMPYYSLYKIMKGTK